MRQKIFTFDGKNTGSRTVEAPGRLRWAGWNRSDDSALIVGDAGTMLAYTGGSIARLQSGTSENLRCAEFSTRGDAAFACGNNGLVLRVTGGIAEPASRIVQENLRRVAWDPSGDRSLFVGNDGAAILRTQNGFETVHGADTHLRSIAWHPRDGYALVAGNCFRDSVGGLSPSPNLFRFDGRSLEVASPVAESRADLVAASWKPDGTSCLIAGFDQTWHTPSLLVYDGSDLKEAVWGNENIFPTACAWHPSGEYALIGTSALTADEGAASIYKFDGGMVTKLLDLGGFGVSCIAWSQEGLALVVASRSIRAFSV